MRVGPRGRAEATADYLQEVQWAGQPLATLENRGTVLREPPDYNLGLTTIEELEKAIRQAKSKKAAGVAQGC